MRRANHLGTVTKRKDNRWEAAVMVDGVRRRVYAKTEEEAWTRLAALRSAVAPPALSYRLTLREWSDKWLHLRSPALRYNTLVSNRASLKLLCATVLGSTALTDLKPLLLAETFSSLLSRCSQNTGSGCKPRTGPSDPSPGETRETRGRAMVGRAWLTLRQCLDDAVTYDEMASNPMKLLPRRSKPTWEKRDRIYWTLSQSQRFIDWTLEQDFTVYPSYPMFVLLALTGLRVGEALALEWSHVDLEAGSLRVTGSLTRTAPGAFVVYPPKTPAGKRTVHLPEKAVQALRLRQQVSPSTSGPIFRTSRGTPAGRSRLGVSLRRACLRCGVPEIHLHGLRHVAAHLALYASRDSHAVKRRLGHTKLALTLDVYDYAEVEDRLVAEALDGLLNKKGADPSNEKPAPG